MTLGRPHNNGVQSPARQKTRVGEFELIARLQAVLDEARKDTRRVAPPPPIVDIGDDAAAVRRGKLVDIYTTDTMVDGVHFRRGQIPWNDLGWKAMASNQSDIAAMGGQPMYALVTLGITAGEYAEDLEEMYRGLSAAGNKYGGQVIGGDIVRSPVLFVTIALTGVADVPASVAEEARAHAMKGAVRQPDVAWEAALLKRSAAQPGDLIGVTGTVGSAAGGLAALDRGISGADAQLLIRSHFRPEPRVPEGSVLVRNGVLAAMDISDGLVADMGKIARMSKVSARIELDRIPIDPALKNLFPNEWAAMALGGGEDYELLFTAPPSLMRHVLLKLGRGAAVIGEIAEAASDGRQAVTVVDSHGQPVPVSHAGWDHLLEP